jgi:hypothetical protein
MSQGTQQASTATHRNRPIPRLKMQVESLDHGPKREGTQENHPSNNHKGAVSEPSDDEQRTQSRGSVAGLTQRLRQNSQIPPPPSYTGPSPQAGHVGRHPSSGSGDERPNLFFKIPQGENSSTSNGSGARPFQGRRAQVEDGGEDSDGDGWRGGD